jgi:hypothetical protein
LIFYSQLKFIRVVDASFDYSSYQSWKSRSKQLDGTGSSGTEATDSGDLKGESEHIAAALSFVEIVALVEAGLPVPGIKTISNRLSELAPMPPKLAPRAKPWEMKSTDATATLATDLKGQ